MFRVYCLIRSDGWKQWEQANMNKPFFAAAKGNSVIDVAWRQAARAEISGIMGRAAGLIAFDLVKCYEYVRHHLLAAKAVSWDYPLFGLSATLTSYGWHRHLLLGKCIASGIISFQGIVAGFAAATIELKLYMHDALSTVIFKNPAVSIDTWIDDITVEGDGEDQDILAAMTKKAGSDFAARSHVAVCVDVWRPRDGSSHLGAVGC